MKKCRFLLLSAALMVSSVAMAQQRNYSGTVLDNNGVPVIGATVKVPGTSAGVVTDLDGNFTISVNPGVKLEISYVGMETSYRTVSDNMTITLKEDSKTLDDVVVIGYGVQKKSVVTAAIAKISSEDISGRSPVRVDNALKGMAAGVLVTASSGQPGASQQVRIRGIGSTNDSNPLYIVDGMPIEGGIDYLNPSDIESIEVLKDAASGAIYGTRAGNGVILVTTKGGQKGKTRVNYNFSYGIQNPWKKRSVLNATEYAVLMNEGLVNAGQAPIYNDPYSYGKGTDWQEELFNYNAPVVTHELNVSGANDKVNYYLSAGYFTQEGIVGGDFGRSNYNRFTLRGNTNYIIFDRSAERKWLNKLDVDMNLSYARIKSTGIDANSQWGSALGSALYLSPILTPTVTGAAAAAQASQYGEDHMLYAPNGEMYTVPGASYNEINNPLALLSLPGDKGWSHNIVANFAANFNLGYGFKYRFSYGAKLAFWGAEGYTRLFYLSSNNRADITDAHQNSDRSTSWQLENVLTWDKKIDKHSINLVFGQSALKEKSSSLSGTAQMLKSYDKPYLNNTSAIRSEGQMAVGGGPGAIHTLSSYFFRASYNYNERYMAQFTIRRFGANNKYATFPSFSLGWNITNEPYIKKPEWLTNAKLRFSWGKNGNERIKDFTYAAWTATGYNAIVGNSAVNGVTTNKIPNPSLQWEASEQTDLGLDLGFFNNALTFTVDYFKKSTNGMILDQVIPEYVGSGRPLGNVGDMSNEGVEFELGYKWKISDVNFGVKANASYLVNDLEKLNIENAYLNGNNMQGTGEITRGYVAYAFPSFYGYKTNGIFQNVDEVNAYKNSKGELIQPNAVPGDVRFVDVDGDGAITSDDRTVIGKGVPDFTYGLSLNVDWKGFDFMAFIQGVAGCDIFDATRRNDIKPANLPSYFLNRWTGEGTSNKYPRFVVGDGVNWQGSDLYLYDGSYMRLKTIQLGYTLPKNLTNKIGIERLRLFVSAENLLTLTKYDGFDPEVSSGDDSGSTMLGVDYGVYPQSRTFTFGLNLSF